MSKLCIKRHILNVLTLRLAKYNQIIIIKRITSSRKCSLKKNAATNWGNLNQKIPNEVFR